MFRRLQWIVIVVALNGCYQGALTPANSGRNQSAAVRAHDTELTQALITGDEERARRLTDEITSGTRSISQAELRDDRPIAANVLLRTTYENRDYQLGVNTVSEYALCVLQIRNHTSSENILRVIAPALQQQCSRSESCEVCNAQAFPVSVEVKRQLIDYWRSKL